MAAWEIFVTRPVKAANSRARSRLVLFTEVLEPLTVSKRALRNRILPSAISIVYAFHVVDVLVFAQEPLELPVIEHPVFTFVPPVTRDLGRFKDQTAGELVALGIKIVLYRA